MKYARVVFEEEIAEDVQMLEIADVLKASIRNWLKILEKESMNALDDVEISNYPYERF